MLTYAFVGAPPTISARLASLLAETAADEVIVAAQIHDHAARLRSYELTAQIMRPTP
jgi:alkanesulfonate monooxygenase SsuD/methylene tetrahydromethanopterin reductase-like flavin-dependent oxidoreductase (luciferase family)